MYKDAKDRNIVASFSSSLIEKIKKGIDNNTWLVYTNRCQMNETDINKVNV